MNKAFIPSLPHQAWDRQQRWRTVLLVRERASVRKWRKQGGFTVVEPTKQGCQVAHKEGHLPTLVLGKEGTGTAAH